MPKLVVELPQGNTFSRSADGGSLADSATRVFKVLLNSPNEALNVFTAIGVNIGDPYSLANPIPCVTVEGRADGDSRLVRIITANYRSSAGAEQGAGDPGTIAPWLRFAEVSVSTSYQELPSWTWFANPTSAPTVMAPAVNPAGDMYDGVTRYEPVVNFSFKQFELNDPSAKTNYVGAVNSNFGYFGSLSLPPRTTLFRSMNYDMHVVQWGGGVLYRGYSVSYEFSFRRNIQFVNGSTAMIGWDMGVPQTGFNVLASVPGAAGVEAYGQPLKHENKKIKTPLALPDNVFSGDKVRAMVKVMEYEEGGASQTPSAQPVALNDNGTPRSSTASPPVLVYRRGQHEQFDFTTLGLRLPI
jgi:hypothetical protein